MRTIDQFLPEHPFFTGLDEKWIVLLTGCASNMHVRAGEYLFHEGEQANMFYVIRRGRVAVEARKPTGGVVVDIIDEGEVVGWSWLVPPYSWTLDARATDDTSAIAFDGKCLREKCKDDPELGYALLQRVVQVMSKRLDSAHIRLLDLYGQPS